MKNLDARRLTNAGEVLDGPDATPAHVTVRAVTSSSLFYFAISLAVGAVGLAALFWALREG
jgi:hypothetical protein